MILTLFIYLFIHSFINFAILFCLLIVLEAVQAVLEEVYGFDLTVKKKNNNKVPKVCAPLL